MNFRIDHVLLPYIQDVRLRLRNLSTAIMTIDGLRSHNTPDARDMVETHVIHVLELPTHTIHLYQPLDLCVVGVTKSDYRTPGEMRTELQEKLSRKMERILKAWRRACCRVNVIAAWKDAGFVYMFRKGAIVSIGINRTFMTTKISE
jgi:hypothetical protein